MDYGVETIIACYFPSVARCCDSRGHAECGCGRHAGEDVVVDVTTMAMSMGVVALNDKAWPMAVNGVVMEGVLATCYCASYQPYGPTVEYRRRLYTQAKPSASVIDAI